jgi:hypothetical protein
MRAARSLVTMKTLLDAQPGARFPERPVFYCLAVLFIVI